MKWALKNQPGFTIVELLIVIVVIAILAAITIVSYNGISQRATDSALQTDIASALKKIETLKIQSDDGNTFPADAAAAGLTSSTLSYYYVAANNTFCVQSKKGNQSYSATNSVPNAVAGTCGENGLVGWWKLNGNANDSSANGYNGTTANTTPDAGQNGVSAQALAFTSASVSNVVVPHNSSLAADPQTFSFWVKPTSWVSGTASTMIAKRHATSSGYFIAYINAASSLSFDCGSSVAAGNRWGTGYTPPFNTWTHIVLTCSTNTGVALYVNGAFNASRPTVDRSAMGSSTSSLRFGQDPIGSALLFNGSMDDVRFYNRVLTAGEINALYTANAQ